MKMPFFIAALILASAFVTPSCAQMTAPAAPAEPAMKPMKPAMDATKPDAADIAAKKAKAKECSMKADARKLHGDARRSFREKCKES